MSVEIFPGRLTPKQILTCSLNDPGIKGVRGVIVAVLVDDDTINISNSAMSAVDLALLARSVQLEYDQVVASLR